MIKILNKILLLKEIQIDSSHEKLNDIISNFDQKSFEIKRLQDGKYTFLSNFSLGTAIVGGNSRMIDGIKIFGEIKQKSESTSILKLTTKVRIELVFIGVFWIGMILFQIFGNEKIPLWINMIMFPAVMIWFWFIYRIQEESLMKKVEKKIKNALQQGI